MPQPISSTSSDVLTSLGHDMYKKDDLDLAFNYVQGGMFIVVCIYSIEEFIRVYFLKHRRRKFYRPILRFLFSICIIITFILKIVATFAYRHFCTPITNQGKGATGFSMFGGYFFLSSFIFLLTHWLTVFVQKHNERFLKGIMITINILTCGVAPIIFFIIFCSVFENKSDVPSHRAAKIHEAEGIYYVVINLIFLVGFTIAGCRIWCMIRHLRGLPEQASLRRQVMIPMIICLLIFTYRAVQLLVLIFLQDEHQVPRIIMSTVNTALGECGLAVVMLISTSIPANRTSKKARKKSTLHSTVTNENASLLNGSNALEHGEISATLGPHNGIYTNDGLSVNSTAQNPHDPLVHVVDKSNGQSLGYGFVKFEHEHEASAAVVALNHFHIGRKVLLVKYSNLQNPSPDTHENSNLYVKSLLPTTNEDDLIRLFSPYGEIDDCKVIIDPVTKKSRQIGFVRFKHQKNADRALRELQGFKLSEDSSPISIKYAETDELRQQRLTKRQNSKSRPQQEQTGHRAIPIQYVEKEDDSGPFEDLRQPTQPLLGSRRHKPIQLTRSQPPNLLPVSLTPAQPPPQQPTYSTLDLQSTNTTIHSFTNIGRSQIVPSDDTTPPLYSSMHDDAGTNAAFWTYHQTMLESPSSPSSLSLSSSSSFSTPEMNLTYPSDSQPSLFAPIQRNAKSALLIPKALPVLPKTGQLPVTHPTGAPLPLNNPLSSGLPPLQPHSPVTLFSQLPPKPDQKSHHVTFPLRQYDQAQAGKPVQAKSPSNAAVSGHKPVSLSALSRSSKLDVTDPMVQLRQDQPISESPSTTSSLNLPPSIFPNSPSISEDLSVPVPSPSAPRFQQFDNETFSAKSFDSQGPSLSSYPDAYPSPSLYLPDFSTFSASKMNQSAFSFPLSLSEKQDDDSDIFSPQMNLNSVDNTSSSLSFNLYTLDQTRPEQTNDVMFGGTEDDGFSELSVQNSGIR
ncbi:hypothetical protein BLNAU_7487 [Blattamonas nauphoetae]|uniref:RRM domain-containing protein n=1 Tax=Blattamonas nauphoetae TaxID=2049346 RepID=A0ABQ9Y1G4_9EUKA|nr:hypothetical protein BLNAU_7487 [Blattamonas nauphoetae]